MVATALKTIDQLAGEAGKLISDPRAALLALSKDGVTKVIAWEDLVPGTLPVRGTENVSVDVLPSATPRGTLAAGASVNFDVPIAEGRRYNIAADVWVDDGAGGAVLFSKQLLVVAHRLTGGAVVKVLETPVVVQASAGFAFSASVSGNNIRFTLANTSDTLRSYNCAIGASVMDKP
jgi:hypothetical protein